MQGFGETNKEANKVIQARDDDGHLSWYIHRIVYTIVFSQSFAIGCVC